MIAQRRISEADWKRWRKLSEVALERYCANVLGQVAKFKEGSDSSHARYVKLFAHLRKCDDQLASVFNDQRRSTAYFQIAAAVQLGIIDRDDLDELSDETQAVVEMLAGTG
jgi:hypothetical protein